MKSFLDEIYDKAYARGRREAILESIKKFSSERFGKLPQRVLAKIDAIDDYSTLENVLRYFWRAKSLKEMKSYVDQIDEQE